MNAEAAEVFDPSGFAMPASSKQAFLKQYVPQDDDEGVRAFFYRKDVYQPHQSKEAGKEIYKSVDYINIRVVGNDKANFHGPARDEHKRRFPFAWQQYEKGEEQAKHGMPLDKIGVAPESIVQYQAKNIFNVEDLAAVTDGNLQHFPPGTRELRHRARQILDQGKSAGFDDRLKALEEQNATLTAQLTAALDKLSEKVPKRAAKE